jgi:hypothetical protein
VVADTVDGWLITRDTVWWETPAATATSRMLTERGRPSRCASPVLVVLSLTTIDEFCGHRSAASTPIVAADVSPVPVRAVSPPGRAESPLVPGRLAADESAEPQGEVGRAWRQPVGR